MADEDGFFTRVGRGLDSLTEKGEHALESAGSRLFAGPSESPAEKMLSALEKNHPDLREVVESAKSLIEGGKTVHHAPKPTTPTSQDFGGKFPLREI
jgi:hypothetical protein